MTKPNPLLSIAAALLLATPLAAQVGSLSDGTLLDTQAQAPAAQPSSEQIGDWDLQCETEGPEPRPCSLHQVVTDDNGSPVIKVTMYRLPEGAKAAAAFTFIVPQMTYLPHQLTLGLDGVMANRLPYEYCNQVGCVAQMGISSIEAEAYKNGSDYTLTLVSVMAPTQPITLKMSLKGFKEAFDKATPVRQ
ncbi:invasion associated locus B family protein [Shimia sp.]|uniref:invasion associated locus B family protein n=1 Tax=Shimia sp. TaxID=1954381 RepID=UPI003569F8B6